ncbi:MAG: DUF2330 domain-containing protein [Armatimonadetes bacterium]|nr:DUF2330 domain-containing protein [Armatimonadota bacterium]
MRALLVLLLALTGASALSDGVYLGTAKAVPLEQPYQRALLRYKDGVETLIVESMVKGEAAELEWLLPVPAKPTSVKALTPGTMETLTSVTAPRLSRVPFFLPLLAGIVLLVTILVALPSYNAKLSGPSAVERMLRHLVFGSLIGCILGLFFLPVFAEGKAAASASSGVESWRVGSYDVMPVGTLEDARGLALGPAAQATLKRLLGSGWTVLRFRLRPNERGVFAPHPIQVTFPTARPVYPMSLTLAERGPVVLDLFVLADAYATPGKMEVWFAQEIGQIYHVPPVTDATWKFVNHPSVKPLLWEGSKLTRLRGTFLLGEEAEVWPSFQASQPDTVALTESKGQTTVMIMIGLLAAAVFVFVWAATGILHEKGRWHMTANGLCLTLSGVLAGSMILLGFFRFAPEGKDSLMTRHENYRLVNDAVPEQAVDRAELVAAIRSKAKKSQERDVPGGFTIKEESSGWTVTTYDRTGGAGTTFVERKQPSAVGASKAN